MSQLIVFCRVAGVVTIAWGLISAAAGARLSQCIYLVVTGAAGVGLSYVYVHVYARMRATSDDSRRDRTAR